MKLSMKIRKTNKAVQTFIQQTLKNYQSMKNKLKKIWACLIIVACAVVTESCNVTRTISTESQYYQKGDTTCTIVTKTIETYDATKKGK